jgi:2-dehydropantoate 2-reductase
MKICIIGAGAIGGYLAVKLALAGEHVTVIDHGPKVDVIRKNGLKLMMHDGREHAARNVKATGNMKEVGAQDIVILAVKAHQVESATKEIQTLFGPDTVVVTTQNGIPWWYFYKHGGEFEGRRVEMVDPNGATANHLDVNRVIGCVVYPAAEVVQPGVIRHIEGDRFPVGELDGTETARVIKVSEAFIKAGFKSPILPNVRSEIWLKLWGNLTFNPISALTHATLVDICQFPLTRNLAAMMMTESQTIANKLGIEFRVPLEKRIAGAEKVGKHKTSMLQDVEAGRGIEIDALIGSVIELGKLTQTPTPHIDTVYACVSLLAKTLADEGARLKAEKLPAGQN